MLFREEKLSQSLPKSNFYFTNSPISPKTLLIFRFLCMTSSLFDYFTQVRVQKKVMKTFRTLLQSQIFHNLWLQLGMEVPKYHRKLSKFGFDGTQWSKVILEFFYFFDFFHFCVPKDHKQRHLVPRTKSEIFFGKLRTNSTIAHERF